MASSRKKVVVRKFGSELLFGYLPPASFLERAERGLRDLELLDLDGNVTFVKAEEIKWICFVREFNSGDRNSPERLLQRSFPRRPRTPGIWLRVELKDRDLLEGLAQNDLSLLDSEGLLLIPPDTRSNTQRIFLPRPAIARLELLAVVGPASPRQPGAALQENLFADKP